VRGRLQAGGALPVAGRGAERDPAGRGAQGGSCPAGPLTGEAGGGPVAATSTVGEAGGGATGGSALGGAPVGWWRRAGRAVGGGSALGGAPALGTAGAPAGWSRPGSLPPGPVGAAPPSGLPSLMVTSCPLAGVVCGGQDAGVPPDPTRTGPDAISHPVGARQLRFRSATVADVEALVALVESAYRGESSRAGWTTEADLLDGQRTDAEGVREVITAPGSRMLVALDAADRQLVACCQLAQRAGGVAYFGMFAVRPGLHGGGIGGQVLAEAERIAREDWTATTMTMSVLAPRADLITWYVRRGYRATGRTEPFPYGDERFGRPLVPDLHFTLLEKPLQP
jgi:GNAT superfamily N-acetyltransferase